MNTRRCALAACAMVILSTAVVQARAFKLWTYEDLLKSSNVVAVVEATANENNNDQWEWNSQFAQGITTTFKVLCYLKGSAPGLDTIRVKHFVYSKGMPPNGGMMINFSVTPYDPDGNKMNPFKSDVFPLQKAHHIRWLAFLKKSADGSFAPTSGQIDPNFSFLALHGGLSGSHENDPTDGMIRESH